MIEIIFFILIFILAVLLGFFIDRALSANKLRETQSQLREFDVAKNDLAAEKRRNILLEVEKKTLAESEQKLRQDYFALTLNFKNLQDEFQRERVRLKLQYDVPPELPRLKESNRLLATEIQKLRLKLKKVKSKDFLSENKVLRQKLKKARNKLIALKEQIEDSKDVEKYQELFNKIQALSTEAQILVKKPQEKINDNLGFFAHQPEINKDLAFKDLMSKAKPNQTASLSSFDIGDDEWEQKTLMNLVDIDDKVYAILLNAGIESFEDLAESNIDDLKLLLEISKQNPEEYQYATWPTQARLALKNKWDLIEEYKLS